MIDLKKITGFEWDKGNLDKSYEKHGITPNEAEEVFLDKEFLLLKDIEHSQKEERFTLIGKNVQEIVLFVSFTIRAAKARIISARKANVRERRHYEEKT